MKISKGTTKSQQN